MGIYNKYIRQQEENNKDVPIIKSQEAIDPTTQLVEKETDLIVTSLMRKAKYNPNNNKLLLLEFIIDNNSDFYKLRYCSGNEMNKLTNLDEGVKTYSKGANLYIKVIEETIKSLENKLENSNFSFKRDEKHLNLEWESASLFEKIIIKISGTTETLDIFEDYIKSNMSLNKSK